MRIRRVRAHAFGPLIDETLELADGMTVIYGPNESAKSTWHAALLSALCGRRRVSRRTKHIRPFERYRPWSGKSWEVSAEIVLADSRRVELRHDLDGGVACYAKDLDVRADYSREITGSAKGEVPDATRWLGLDRRAFLATACVRQADVMSVVERDNGVREHLQRAAATAGKDETAAGALRALTEYQQTWVGTAHSRTKPLQVAEHAVAAAAQSLSRARHDHQQFELRAVETRELRDAAEAARARLHGHEAAQAHAEAARLRSEADRLRRRAKDAAELAAELDTPAPDDPAAAAAAAAVAAWESLPPLPAAPSSVDSVRAGRVGSVVALASAAALVVAGAVLFGVGSIAPAVAALAAGFVAAAVGLFQSGRAAGRSAAAIRAGGPADERRQWDSARERATTHLLAAAEAVGARVDRPAAAVPMITAWLAEEPARAARRELRVAQNARLVDLLDGRTLADLHQSADEATAVAARAAEHLPAAPDGGMTADGIALRHEYEQLERRASVAEQELARHTEGLMSVPEVEELAAARTADLSRLRELDRILGLTQTFLMRAQDEVHREIAPALRAAVERDLAAVTAGRYTEAVVDPGSLAVQIRGPGGPLRDIEQLSHGTVEQVYLLLRVALAEQLVRPGESAPLLLDEVTAHADRDRTDQVLRLLLSVAQRHQVVLFTQQDQVRDWARTHLDGERHALRELSPLSTV